MHWTQSDSSSYFCVDWHKEPISLFNQVQTLISNPTYYVQEIPARPTQGVFVSFLISSEPDLKQHLLLLEWDFLFFLLSSGYCMCAAPFSDAVFSSPRSPAYTQQHMNVLRHKKQRISSSLCLDSNNESGSVMLTPAANQQRKNHLSHHHQHLFFPSFLKTLRKKWKSWLYCNA